MPRTRSFDEAVVLDQAMETFWRQGFEATSIDDLCAATGLSRSSIYQAYESKLGVFERVLDFYGANRIDGMLARLESGEAGLEDVVAFFETIAEIAQELPARAALGCLLTNSMTELGATQARMRPYADAYVRRLTDAFAAALDRASSLGEITPGTTEERSTLLATLTLGLFVRTRGNHDPTGAISVASSARALTESWAHAS